jgi:hypothetical protein
MVPSRKGRITRIGASGQKHANAARLLVHSLQKTVVEKMERRHMNHLHIGGLRRVERRAFHHGVGIEIPRIESRIHRRREPDEPAPDALAKREAEFELGARLVNFIDDDRVLHADLAGLEPPPRDAGRHDHDVPRRRVGCRFALSVDHAHAETAHPIDPQQRLRDWPDREGLAGARACDDPETATRAPRRGREVLGTELLCERRELRPMLAPEQRVDVEREGEFDRLTRRACGRDYDDPSWSGGR